MYKKDNGFRQTNRTGRNNRLSGARYEETAAEFLQRQGLYILEKNYRCRQGEIDLIAMDGRYLVFVEVKYRKDTAKGDPAEAVGFYKRQHIYRTAKYYLYSHRYGANVPCRFDVVSILGEEISWIQNAFSV